MPLNLDKIKQRLNELTGNRTKNSELKKLWTPKIGTHLIRIVPLKNKDGMPFEELWWYFDLAKPAPLALCKLDKRDPVHEFQQKLWQDQTDASKELAKKLFPKCRAYAPVLVRGEESEGVRLWGLSNSVYIKLLEKFHDSDYGDITDPLEGFDIKVTVKQEQGRMYPHSDVEVKPRPSKLADDKKMIQEYVNSVPDAFEVFKDREKSYDELAAILDKWASNGGKQVTSRGNNSEDLEFPLKNSNGENGSEITAKGNDEEKSTVKHQYNEKLLDEAFKELLENE